MKRAAADKDLIPGGTGGGPAWAQLTQLSVVQRKTVVMKTCTFRMALFVWLATLAGAPVFGGVRLQIIPEGCSVTPEERQELQAMVDLEWDYLRRVFRTQENVVMIIRLFGSEEAYNRYYDHRNAAWNPLYGHSLPVRGPRPQGYYSLNEGVVMYKSAQFLKVVHHEASHFLYALKAPCPHRWLDEGLACYFQEARMENGQFIVEPSICGRCGKDHRWEQLRQRVRTGQLVPLGNFVALHGCAWKNLMDLNEGGVLYSTASSLVHFLMQTDRGVAILEAMLRTSRYDNPIATIDRSYPGGVRQMEADWHAWLDATACTGE